MNVSQVPVEAKRDFPPVRLYLQDVSTLHETMQMVGDSVELHADGKSCTEKDEIEGLVPGLVRELTITAYAADGSTTASIEVSSSNVQTRFRDSLAHENARSLIDGRLRLRRRKVMRLAVLWPVVLVLGLVGWTLGHVATRITNAPAWFLPVGSILELVPLAVVVLLFIREPTSLVWLQRREVTSGFLRRNQDSMVVAAVFLLLGLISGWLFKQ